jgi:spore maturation protein CgeB
MRIAYHMPAATTVYAQRTIYNGFRRAFEDLGHDFLTFTAGSDPRGWFEEQAPDLFVTNVHFFYRKQLDLPWLQTFRSRSGMVMLTKTDFWNPLEQRLRLNESRSMREDGALVRMMQAGTLGDAFFHVVEAGDGRMAGFEETIGYPLHTIPLAADATTMTQARVEERFSAAASYIGTNSPAKRDALEQLVLPLRSRGLRLYGQDWTRVDRMKGHLQRVGQYFNLPGLRSLQKPALRLEDEGSVYASSLINVNVHEWHQVRYGGDCNERTFKVPLAGGFQLVDGVACIARYLEPGREVVMAESTDDWFAKFDHYVRNPDQRLPIIEAGRRRVLSEHTYHQRAQQMLDLVSTSA